ncbi:MAG: ferrochelatase [Acidobacteria bacterium RIFCSPLOWO2_02_FULL_68_18]|nr:MAG: ferrochelatase [Acidobacteria bacterium RIFCSPLOWO2_02_FULL_68_18]OFW52089.1 MAG: ferrochelatase [Acidobacteria bacterium RIFCSPLOWO2_12_FULL_68_19]
MQCDGVLIVAFGGPGGPADVRPFLERVLRGRRVTPSRIDEIARHYELFGGVSPLTELTMRQARGLEARLAEAGRPLPVYVGMRNWHPLLADTFRQMHAAGRRHVVGFIAAPHHSQSSCQMYRENVVEARRELRAAAGGDVNVTYVGSWFDHPLFVEVNARHVLAARERLPAAVAGGARLVCTAHSIPLPMAEASRYREQLGDSARLVAERTGIGDWAVVYQSRSGRPEDPWLEPDVCAYLRAERARGLAAAILCPVGFVCDHIEVLYDLDRGAAGVCREIGLPMVRAEAVNADPLFLDMMADVVLRTIRRYETGRPLPIVSA